MYPSGPYLNSKLILVRARIISSKSISIFSSVGMPKGGQVSRVGYLFLRTSKQYASLLLFARAKVPKVRCAVFLVQGSNHTRPLLLRCVSVRWDVLKILLVIGIEGEVCVHKGASAASIAASHARV